MRNDELLIAIRSTRKIADLFVIVVNILKSNFAVRTRERDQHQILSRKDLPMYGVRTFEKRLIFFLFSFPISLTFLFVSYRNRSDEQIVCRYFVDRRKEEEEVSTKANGCMARVYLSPRC